VFIKGTIYKNKSGELFVATEGTKLVTIRKGEHVEETDISPKEYTKVYISIEDLSKKWGVDVAFIDKTISRRHFALRENPSDSNPRMDPVQGEPPIKECKDLSEYNQESLSWLEKFRQALGL